MKISMKVIEVVCDGEGECVGEAGKARGGCRRVVKGVGVGGVGGFRV